MAASSDTGGVAGAKAEGAAVTRFDNVMAALGSVLFRWCLLEAALGAGLKPVGALEGDIDHVRSQRNMIVHGLVSVSIDPVTGTTSIQCKRNRNPGAPHRIFSLPELQAMAQAMDSCRLRLLRSQ